MDILFLSVRVIAPIFGLILIGFIVKFKKILSENDAQKLNLLCFHIFLPALCFNSTYKTSAAAGDYWKLIAFITFVFCLMTFLVFLIVPRFEPNKYRKGVDVQGVYRSNALLMGLPMAINFFGPDGALPTVLSVGVILPFQNFFAVAALTHYISEDGNPLCHFKKTVVGIIKNPLIIGILLGLLFSAGGVYLPVLLEDMVSELAGVATTLALISLGATFSFGGMVRNLRHVFWIGAGKLILYPAAAILLAVALNFSGPELIAVIAVFATPCGISGYSMAAATENDCELAGQLVVATSMAAVVTLTSILSICQASGVL